MGQSDWDVEDDKRRPDHEYEVFSQELASLNTKSESYWIDVLMLLKKTTSFFCIGYLV